MLNASKVPMILAQKRTQRGHMQADVHTAASGGHLVEAKSAAGPPRDLESAAAASPAGRKPASLRCTSKT